MNNTLFENFEVEAKEESIKFLTSWYSFEDDDFDGFGESERGPEIYDCVRSTNGLYVATTCNYMGIVYSYNDGLYSTLGDWKRTNITKGSFYKIFYIEKANIWLTAGDDGEHTGLFISHDGMEWKFINEVPVNNPEKIKYAVNLDYHYEIKVLVGGGDSGLFWSTDFEEWYKVEFDIDGNYNIMDILFEDNIFVISIEDHGLYYSFNGVEFTQCIAEFKIENNTFNNIIRTPQYWLASYITGDIYFSYNGMKWYPMIYIGERVDIFYYFDDILIVCTDKNVYYKDFSGKSDKWFHNGTLYVDGEKFDPNLKIYSFSNTHITQKYKDKDKVTSIDVDIIFMNTDFGIFYSLNGKEWYQTNVYKEAYFAIKNDIFSSHYPYHIVGPYQIVYELKPINCFFNLKLKETSTPNDVKSYVIGNTSIDIFGDKAVISSGDNTKIVITEDGIMIK
jgi:hypothetical protein